MLIAKRPFGIISAHSFQTHTSHPGSKTEKEKRNKCVSINLINEKKDNNKNPFYASRKPFTEFHIKVYFLPTFFNN